MKSEKGNNNFGDGQFDDKLKSLFEDHQINNFTPNWTKMSNMLEDVNLDDSIYDKLSNFKTPQASQWQKMSSDLDLINDRRKHILIKQILEITLAILLFLILGQGIENLYQKNIIEIEPLKNETIATNLSSESTSSNQKIVITKINQKVNDTSKSDSKNMINNNDKTPQNEKDQKIASSNKKSKSNTNSKHSKSNSKSVNGKANTTQFGSSQIELNSIKEKSLTIFDKGSTLDSKATSTSQNDDNQPINTNIILNNSSSKSNPLSNIELLKLSKFDNNVSLNDQYLDISEIVKDIGEKEIDIKKKKQVIWVSPHLSMDFNTINYPKDTFFIDDTIAIHTWNDTTIRSSNLSYGLSFIIPKKHWILEADISISTIRSNHYKTYVRGKSLKDLARWTLNSEKFNLYSIGLNINPVLFKTPLFTAHGILGARFNIIYKYTPYTTFEVITQGERPDGWFPHPRSDEEDSGQALFASNNTGKTDNYSYVMLKFGIGGMYKVDSNISLMARVSYNYNYLNKYITKSTAQINTLNTKIGIMFHF